MRKSPVVTTREFGTRDALSHLCRELYPVSPVSPVCTRVYRAYVQRIQRTESSEVRVTAVTGDKRLKSTERTAGINETVYLDGEPIARRGRRCIATASLSAICSVCGEVPDSVHMPQIGRDTFVCPIHCDVCRHQTRRRRRKGAGNALTTEKKSASSSDRSAQPADTEQEMMHLASLALRLARANASQGEG
jgi:hypothetical protein